MGRKILLLSLVMACGLAIGCGVPSATSPPSSTSAPQASTYPADISGRVTIAEKVQCLTAIPVPPQDKSAVFWIVDISVRNASYDNAIAASLDTGYKGWELVSGNNVYRPVNCGLNEPVSIPPGGSGHVMVYFAVPNTLQISDAKVCYRGQEPYSYGRLTGGDKVVAYDWDSKEVVEEPRYVPVSPPPEYECPKPHGLYSATTTVGKETAEFENDKFVRLNPWAGKFVYRYRILDGCNKIELTDVVTGEVKVYEFKYSEEYGYVVIDGWATYWKE